MIRVFDKLQVSRPPLGNVPVLCPVIELRSLTSRSIGSLHTIMTLNGEHNIYNTVNISIHCIAGRHYISLKSFNLIYNYKRA